MRMPVGKAVAMAVTCLLGIAASIAISSNDGRYGIAHEIQKYYSCLPFSLYWVDYEPEGVQRGDLVQITAPSWDDRFREGIPLIKVVAAVEGDVLEVRDEGVFINGEFWGDLFMRKSLGEPEGHFDRRTVVGEGQIAVLGVTPSSYDSRYWGLIQASDIHGKATAIL